MNIENNLEELLEEENILSILELAVKIMKLKGLDISPFKELLNGIIDEKIIRESSMGFGIVTFSLKGFKALRIYKNDIPEGELIDYIIASCALPAFKKHEINNDIFLDGAFCDNVPLSLAINDNKENIIVVDMLSPGIIHKVDTRKLNVIIIKNPFELKGSTLNFNKDNILFNMQLGYLDTKKAFKHLKGYRYYIENNKEILYYTNKYISSLTYKDIKRMYSHFGVQTTSKKNIRDKKILNEIMEVFKIYSGTEEISKETILLSIVEILADFLEIPKAQVYTIDEIIDEILKRGSSVFGKINKDEYLNYVKNVVDLNKKEEWLDFASSGNKLAFYTKLCLENKVPIKFRRIISKIYPKFSIASGTLIFLEYKGQHKSRKVKRWKKENDLIKLWPIWVLVQESK